MKNLEQSLLNARKFMEHSAMNKSGEKRNISPPSVPSTTNNLQEAQLPQTGVPTSRQPNMNPKANINEESIMNSRLPDAIKKAMIDTPIPDINPTPQLSESFVDKVSEKMNSQKYSVENMRNTANSNVNVPVPPTSYSPSTSDPIPTLGSTDLDKNTLKETIKECIKEILKEEKVLMESTNIKENLQLRVGNKLFTGNIKNVKTIK